MKKQILFFTLILLTAFSCTTIKTYMLMRKGEVKQKEFTSIVPFTFHNNRIIIKVEIEGETYNFFVDTGAPNVISKELAQKLNLIPAFSAEVGDAVDNSIDLSFVSIDNIRIGNIDFLNTGAVISDFNKTNFIYCMEIDGFIGANLMKEAVWKVNPETQEITITNAISALQLPPGIKIPFKKRVNGSPIIDVNCNGIKVKDVLIDLGSSAGIKIPMHVYHQMKSKDFPIALGFGSASAGLTGDSKPDSIRKTILPHFALGELALKSQLVFFDKHSDRIGMDFLENYTMVFNWFDKEMTLIENKKTKKYTFKSFGFKYNLKDSKLLVSFIYNESSAQKMGLKIGDEILKMNAVDCKNVTFDRFCEISDTNLFSNAEKMIITLQREEEVIELKLEKYNLLE